MTEEDCCRSCRISRSSHEGALVRAVETGVHAQLRPSSPCAAVEKCSEETPPRRRLCPPDRGMRRHQRGCPRRRRRSEVPWDVSPGAESLRIKENPPATSGTFDAVGDISVRVGAFDAVGDSNPVPGCAGCPRPERRAPGRVECPRPQEPGGRTVPAEMRSPTAGSSDGGTTQGGLFTGLADADICAVHSTFDRCRE